MITAVIINHHVGLGIKVLGIIWGSVTYRGYVSQSISTLISTGRQLVMRSLLKGSFGEIPPYVDPADRGQGLVSD